MGLTENRIYLLWLFFFFLKCGAIFELYFFFRFLAKEG